MTLTGADLLVQTALAHDIDHCFANPGTTELHLVQALDGAAQMRSVLCAFEGVCSGAADGFARMAGRPALGLFHLGPGYANALANLHNARRHHTPMVNVIGDQASWHLAADAPLTSDIDALSGWTGRTYRTTGADDVGDTTAEAIAAALAGPERISNIVLAADHAWSATDRQPTAASGRPVPLAPSDETVNEVVAALGRPGGALILGGVHVGERTIQLAAAIAAATGCAVFGTRSARLEIGRHLPMVNELPYFPQPLQAALADVSSAVITGKGEPVTFFGYPDVRSEALPAAAERVVLSGFDDDLDLSLEAVATALGVDAAAGSGGAGGTREMLPHVEPGPLSPRNLGQAFARALPENAIVVAEAVSSGGGYRALAPHAAPHTLLGVNGGAIGGGLPAAVGAAVACPDRPVFVLQADGSALYTIQSLWTMARESLDVTVVICANRRYQILDVELQAAGIELASSLTSLDDPAVNFAEVAAGFGVPSISVHTGEELELALERALAEPGPNLIEAILTP